MKIINLDVPSPSLPQIKAVIEFDPWPFASDCIECTGVGYIDDEGTDYEADEWTLNCILSDTLKTDKLFVIMEDGTTNISSWHGVAAYRARLTGKPS